MYMCNADLPLPDADSADLETEGANTYQHCFPDVVQVEQQEAADLNGLLRSHSKLLGPAPPTRTLFSQNTAWCCLYMVAWCLMSHA